MPKTTANHTYLRMQQMARTYEDGLHPVIHDGPEAMRNSQIYTTLPQSFTPDRSPNSAPEAYVPVEKNSFANAPQPVEPSSPPSYYGDNIGTDGKDGLHDDLVAGGILEHGSAEKNKKNKKFIMIGATVLLVVLILVISLSVGLTRRNRNEDATTASASPTAIEQTAATPSTTASQPVATSGFTGLAEVKCPSINNTVINSGTSRFRTLCAVHWITGQPAENNNGTVQSVGSNRLVAYTLEECLGHCVAYNAQLNRTVDPDENGSGCLAVTYNANLSVSFSKYQQNCFLKDRQGVYDPAADSTESAVLVGA